MAITRRAYAYTNWAFATSVAIAKPSGTSEGDILVAILTHEYDATASPAGWTKWAQVSITSPRLFLSVWWVRAGASEPSSYSWSFTAGFNGGKIAAYSGGIASGDPIDGTYALADGTSGTNPYAASVTTSVQDAMLVCGGVSYSVTAWSAAMGGGGELQEWSTESDSGVHGYDGLKAVPGATGVLSGSVVPSGIWETIHLALKPVVVASALAPLFYRRR